MIIPIGAAGCRVKWQEILPGLTRPNPKDTKSPSLSRSRGSARPGRQSITFDTGAPACSLAFSRYFIVVRDSTSRVAPSRGSRMTRNLSHREPEEATADQRCVPSRRRRRRRRRRPASSRPSTGESRSGCALRVNSLTRFSLFLSAFHIRFYERGTIERTPLWTSTVQRLRERDPIEDFYRLLSVSPTFPVYSFEYVSRRCAPLLGEMRDKTRASWETLGIKFKPIRESRLSDCARDASVR